MGGPEGQDPPHQVERRPNRLTTLVTPGDASRHCRHPSSSSRLPGGLPVARRLTLPLFSCEGSYSSSPFDSAPSPQGFILIVMCACTSVSRASSFPTFFGSMLFWAFSWASDDFSWVCSLFLVARSHLSRLRSSRDLSSSRFSFATMT